MAGEMIVTIGRQFGSGGHEIGRKLAAEMGYQIYDKELLKIQAKESGIAEKVLESYDESPTNSLLYSIVMDVYPSMNYVGTSLNQQIFQAQYDTIRKLKDQGNCVIIGRGADYILRDCPNLVSVFITASMDIRIRRVAEYEKCPENKARDIITKADKKRANFYNFQTEKKWGHASSYNLCIDSSITGYDGAVMLIKEFVELRRKHLGFA